MAPSADISGVPLPELTPVVADAPVMTEFASELACCHDGSAYTELTPPCDPSPLDGVLYQTASVLSPVVPVPVVDAVPLTVVWRPPTAVIPYVL